jgi:hypothetical protein
VTAANLDASKDHLSAALLSHLGMIFFKGELSGTLEFSEASFPAISTFPGMLAAAVLAFLF